MGESLVDLILKNGDTDRRAAQEYCDLKRHIAELEARIVDLDEYNHSAMDMVRDQAVRICELYDDLNTANKTTLEDFSSFCRDKYRIELENIASEWINSLTGKE